MKLPQQSLRKPRIEIIPMIDTIFFLLVFFMLSSLSMVHMNGLGLNVPRDSAPSVSTHRDKPLVVAVSPTGQYYLNSRPLPKGALPSILLGLLQTRPSAVVVLNIAPEQKTQTFITALDTVNTVITEAGSHATVVVATQAPRPLEASHASH